jgi:hypothetical protein
MRNPHEIHIRQSGRGHRQEQDEDSRVINSGKLRAIRHEQGEYEIDPSELMRVYDIVTPEPQKRNDMERSVTPVMLDEAPVLRAEIEGLKQQLALLKDERDDLRRRLDEDSAEHRRLTLLLTDPTNKPASAPEPRPSFLKRLFGS